MTTTKWAIGVDIGGTKIAIASIDEKGNILQQIVVKTDIQGGQTAVVNQIIAAVHELRKTVQNRPIGIGVGMAGQIEADSGVVRFAPNLYWHDTPLKSLLENALEVPVVIINDVRAGTWGEWQHGAGKGCEDIVCLFVGTGIGGGIVSAGKMLIGNSNTAGELGHITIDLQGRECTCGNRGCLEAIAGGWAIAERAREAIGKNPKEGAALLKLSEGDLKNLTAKMVIEQAHVGDPLANRIMDETVEALIAGSVSIVNGINPKRLIFGGGIIKGMPEMVTRIEKGVRQRALLAACKSLEVLPSKLGPESGVIGAGSYAMSIFNTDKH